MKEDPNRFTYAQAFPGDWLHSPELKDRPWTVRIVGAERKELKNHKTGKVDTRLIFTFAHPRTGEVLDHKYISSKTNGYICAQAFGEWNTDWIGHLVTIAAVPCDFGPWGTRVAFIGSPDIEKDMPMVTPGDRHMVFKKTEADNAPPSGPDSDPESAALDDLEAEETNGTDPDDETGFGELEEAELTDWQKNDPRKAKQGRLA